jgi:hypothetical protein
VVVILGGGIALSAAFGLWQTTSNKIPARYASGVHAGEFNPADIRGSYSFGDIERAFGVPAADLARAFAMGLVADPAALRAKDLESRYGAVEGGEIGTDSIRYFVALYTGLPYSPAPETLLPEPAIGVLRARLPEERLEAVAAALGERTVSPSAARSGEAGAEHGESDDTAVKGRTTFGELLSLGLTKEEIEQAIGMQMGSRGVTVREHVTEAGAEFRNAREALQALVDAKTRR